MGVRFDRLRCEVFQNLFLIPMNTGFVRSAIAIVPTACGIETFQPCDLFESHSIIAIVPTACGIETGASPQYLLHCDYQIAIVPTACGIETEILK